jgi:hypothetical protein
MEWGVQMQVEVQAQFRCTKDIVQGLLKKVNRRWSIAKVRETSWVTEAMQVDGGLRRQEWSDD